MDTKKAINTIHVVTDTRQLESFSSDTEFCLVIGSRLALEAERQGKTVKDWWEYRTEEINFLHAASEATNLIEAWSHLPLDGTNALRQLFVHDGQSVWDIVEPDLFWVLTHILEDVMLVDQIIQSIKPKNIVLHGTRHRVERIFKIIGQLHSIPITVQGGTRIGRWFRSRIEMVFLTRISIRNRKTRKISIPRNIQWAMYSMRGLLRSIKGNLELRKKGIKSQRAEVLYISVGRDNGVGPDGFRRILLQARKEGQDFCVVDWLFSRAKQQALGISAPFDSFDAYITPRILWDAARIGQKFFTDWRRATRSAAFRDLFTFRGVPMWTLIEIPLSEIIGWRMPQVVQVYETARSVVQKKRAKLIIAPDKHISESRALFLGARASGGITVALPGRAGEYMDREHVGTPVQVADWTLTEGQGMRNWLIERGANEKSIIITGSPMADVALSRNLVDSRAKVCDTYGFQLDKPIVLIITSNVNNQEVNRIELKLPYIRGVFAAIKNLPEFQFIVKLHPSEIEDLEESIAIEMGLSELKIVQHVDIYELIAASDLIIFNNSTVGHETVNMQRPIVQVNLSPSESDVFPCAKFGAALGVYSGGDIAAAISSVLFDETVRENLSAGRNRYINEYSHGVDGKSVERIVGFISALLTSEAKS